MIDRDFVLLTNESGDWECLFINEQIELSQSSISMIDVVKLMKYGYSSFTWYEVTDEYLEEYGNGCTGFYGKDDPAFENNLIKIQLSI